MPKNMTNTINFFTDPGKEGRDLAKGKICFGGISYRFGTWTCAARWILSKEGQKKLKWARGGITWAEEDGRGPIIACSTFNYPLSIERINSRAEEILADPEIAAQDKAYLEHWNNME
jgi:hypothetical protein